MISFFLKKPMNTIRVNSIDYKGSVVDGPGVRSLVFLQGCDVHCEGCHNESAWDMEGGELFDIEDLADQLKAKCTNKKLTITGGEPLCQPKSLEKLVSKLEDFDLCLYTSHELEKVPKEIVDKLTYIKTGPFIKEKRTTTKRIRPAVVSIFQQLSLFLL